MAEGGLGGDEEMTFSCVVPECQSQQADNYMFRIPRNVTLSNKWKEMICRPEITDWSKGT